MHLKQIRDVIDELYSSHENVDKLKELACMAATALLTEGSDNCEVNSAGHTISIVITKD